MSDLSILRRDVKGNEFDELFVILVPGEPMLGSLIVYFSREQAESILRSDLDEGEQNPQFANLSKAFVQRYVKG